MANKIECDGPGCGKQVLNNPNNLHRWIQVAEIQTHEDGGLEPIDGIYCTYTCLRQKISETLGDSSSEENHGR